MDQDVLGLDIAVQKHLVMETPEPFEDLHEVVADFQLSDGMPLPLLFQVSAQIPLVAILQNLVDRLVLLNPDKVVES